MKVLIIAILAIAAFAGSLFGQSLRDEEILLKFTTLVRNVDIVNPSTKQLTNDNLSYGFSAGYLHWFGRKNGRGDVGMGFETLVAFHSVGESKLALIRPAYVLKVQKNAAPKFQPFASGSIGVACDHWTKKGRNSPTNTGCPALSYGGAVGFAIPVSEGSRRKVSFELGYFTTNFRNPANAFRRELQHNLTAAVGFHL